MIEFGRDVVALSLGESAEMSSPGQILAEKPVGVLVGPALPGVVREGECKFWLEPIGLASVRGVKPHDVRTIEQLIFEHQVALLAAYHEFHRSRRA
jgi:hypothetical protein